MLDSTKSWLTILALAASLAFVACSTAPVERHPGDVRNLVADSPTEDTVAFLPISPEERPTLLGEVAGGAYLIGVGDTLRVSSNVPAWQGVGSQVVVKSDGNIYLPGVPPVAAASHTEIEVQKKLVEHLSAGDGAIPFVSVDIAEYRSQQFYVMGAVASPGTFPVDGRTTLLSAVAGAGGVSQRARIDAAYVMRGGRVLPLSLADLLVRGDETRNIKMQHGDLVYVPGWDESQVYVLGEVASPGVVPIRSGRLTLAEAIAASGDLLPETADYNTIRIFRGTWDAPRCFTVAACELYLYGESIVLHPGDRVLVAPAAQSAYEQVLELVGPLVGAGTSAAAVAARGS